MKASAVRQSPSERPGLQQDYRANRPVVERKIGHFTRRPWGGRKARCRGRTRILTDILTRASAINLARLATLGLHHAPTGWPSPDPTSHPPRGGPSFISRQQSTIQCHRHQPHHRHYISSVLGTQRPVADRRHPVCSHDGHIPVHLQALPCRPAQPPRSTGRKPFDAGPAGITINGPSRP